jgi:protein gp37
MAETTTIEWADKTWSPWEGCTKVSPGCDNCYAAAMNNWLRRGENWGPGAPRREFSEDHWKKLERWNAQAEKAGKRVKVFPSICDPFDNEVRPELRARHWALMMLTPWLDHLILTKRIGNAAQMLAAPGMPNIVLPNVWIGATVVNQEEADRDIPKLLATPARMRFLSVEPMLGPVDLTAEYLTAKLGAYPFKNLAPEHRTRLVDLLDWIICGAESGRQARPMHVDWARSLRDQCEAANVPFMLKQWGEWIDHDQPGVDMLGTEASPLLQWADGSCSVRLGKKLTGRLLDGVLHDGFPEVRNA